MIPALIAGGAALMGGYLSNRSSAKQAAAANEMSWDMQMESQRYNAAQAADARAYGTAEMREVFGLNQQSAREAMQFSREEAATNRQFQMDQAANAHRMEVADLRAAGLNPILSGTGGAGAHASAGGMAQAQTASVSRGGSAAGHAGGGSGQQARVVDMVGPAVSAALQVYKQRAEIEALESQAQAARAQGYKTAVEGARESINWSMDTTFRADERTAALEKLIGEKEFASSHGKRETRLDIIDSELLTKERLSALKLLEEQGRAAEASAKSAAEKARLDKLFSYYERMIGMGEGATSAVRNLNPFRIFGK